MTVVDIAYYPSDPRPARWYNPVLALGNFDGLHRGHMKIIDRVRQRAGERGGTPVAMTFDPHPPRVLRPEKAPALAWAGNLGGRDGGFGSWTRVVVPLALLVIGLAGLYTWQQKQKVADVEELDAQLLSDDLPIDAYLDKGFEVWLKKRGAR